MLGRRPSGRVQKGVVIYKQLKAKKTNHEKATGNYQYVHGLEGPE